MRPLIEMLANMDRSREEAETFKPVSDSFDISFAGFTRKRYSSRPSRTAYATDMLLIAINMISVISPGRGEEGNWLTSPRSTG